MAIYAQENFINADKGYEYGEGDVQETFSDSPGELYRAYVKEYGRCISKVYRDIKGKTEPAACGWVFQKRVPYDDARTEKDTYLREVWVTLHEKPPQVTRTEFPFYLKEGRKS